MVVHITPDSCTLLNIREAYKHINITYKQSLSQILQLNEQHFKNFQLEILFKTPKSLKANIILGENLFIALRYNARNERDECLEDSENLESASEQFSGIQKDLVRKVEMFLVQLKNLLRLVIKVL